MEAVVPQEKIRLLARAFRLLSSISEEISIESDQDRLNLSALSPSQSAFARFTFHSSFFTSFSHQSRRVRGISSSSSSSVARAAPLPSSGSKRRREVRFDEEAPPSLARPAPSSSSPSFEFKECVNSKAALLAFRSQLSAVSSLTLKLTDHEEEGFTEIERRLRGFRGERSGVYAEAEARGRCGGALLLQLHSVNKAIFRTFHSAFLDSQGTVLHPNFKRDQCSTFARIEAQKLRQWLDHFPRGIDELSLTFAQNDVSFKSYLDWQIAAASQGEEGDESTRSSRARNRVVTDYSVPSADFSPYEIEQECRDSPIVFCFPEFKYFVEVCEAAKANAWIYAQGPGQPIMITNSDRVLSRKRENPLETDSNSIIDDDAFTSASRSHSHSWSESHNNDQQQQQNEPQPQADLDRLTWSGEVILATLSKALLSQNSQPEPRNAPAASAAEQQQPQFQKEQEEKEEEDVKRPPSSMEEGEEYKQEAEQERDYQEEVPYDDVIF